MNKTDALKEVFNESRLSNYLRCNKHRFKKGTLNDSTASNILKKKGYKMIQQEQWEKKPTKNKN